jgi:hypothetical protein
MRIISNSLKCPEEKSKEMKMKMKIVKNCIMISITVKEVKNMVHPISESN